MFTFLLKRTKRRVGLQVIMTERSWITWLVCVTTLGVFVSAAVMAVAVHEPGLIMLVVQAILAVLPLP